jgi:hypothetical protein
MALIGHSHLNSARHRNILMDILYLEGILLTVEVDWKITSMGGQEFVRAIYNLGICFKNQVKPYEFSPRTNGNGAEHPSGYLHSISAEG